MSRARSKVLLTRATTMETSYRPARPTAPRRPPIPGRVRSSGERGGMSWTAAVTALAAGLTAVTGLLAAPFSPLRHDRSSEKGVTRAAWDQQVNPRCTALLNEVGATITHLQTAREATQAGDFQALRNLAQIDLPQAVKAFDKFNTQVNNIERPAKDEPSIAEFLAAEKRLAVTFGQWEGHYQHIADVAQTTLLDAQRRAQAGASINLQAMGEDVNAAVAADRRALDDSSKASAGFAAAFRDTAEELGANECAKLGTFEMGTS
jgi:hypothetical protein